MTQPKTRTLWLIRHAKAVDPAPTQYDFNRELAPRGQADVDAFVAHCKSHQVAAASWLWVCPAARTQQRGMRWHGWPQSGHQRFAALVAT